VLGSWVGNVRDCLLDDDADDVDDDDDDDDADNFV
jgi:hypothetical protein